MPENFLITLAQLNPVLGDISGNVAKAMAAHQQAKTAKADLLALPEMFLTGYQTQDLILKPAFQADAAAQLLHLAQECADGPAMAIGAPLVENGMLYNAYFLLQNGKVNVVARKHHLPNEDVFDEQRLFDSGAISGPFNVNGVRIGAPVCEDAWHQDVAETMAETGAEILLVPNGSPYRRGKHDLRTGLMVSRVVETGLPLVYLNMVGGQDDQVFDGGTFVLNPGGDLALQLPVFEENITTIEFIRDNSGWQAVRGTRDIHGDEWQQDYRCMVMALRDYMAKTGFEKVLLGLSGGIDSAIVATIAVDALGPQNVRCVMLPSEYTSQESLEDAANVAKALGCELNTVSIAAGRAAITETLAPLFEGMDADVTEENIQSRLRGLLLMAMSNKFGSMLLTTGNKSEVAVGYATIYGDMAGGFNPIKDLYKTRVFETCRWRNKNHFDWMMGPAGQVISPNIIDKPPTAELRDNQKDSDSLPEYAVLDEILEALIDHEKSVADVVAMGHDRAIVKRVENLIYISEHKRFQSAPGTRLTLKAFWLDRRYPIVNRWRDNA